MLVLCLAIVASITSSIFGVRYFKEREAGRICYEQYLSIKNHLQSQVINISRERSSFRDDIKILVHDDYTASATYIQTYNKWRDYYGLLEKIEYPTEPEDGMTSNESREAFNQVR